MTYVIIKKRDVYLAAIRKGKPIWTEDLDMAARFEDKPWETLANLGLSNRHLIKEPKRVY